MILCGGVGERLWPASRPGRSKPFIPLVGAPPIRSTLKRARAIGSEGRDVVIVGAPSEAAQMEAELAGVGLSGRLLLE
ncbi:MAG: sugar phosphate nucleotidyltransferase, partial [Phenylobacterium sp.]|nr:sugar phosphate nucleotidyltransferase [Phenylobacterium sp.]